MSYIVDGAQGQDWQGANWVFLSMSEPLLSVLREVRDAGPLAERLAETMNGESGYLDLSDLLESPEMSGIWVKAVDEAIARMRERGSTHWHRPEEFEGFLEKVSGLKNLALVRQPA